MDKILLTIEVPSVECQFDILAPCFTTAQQLRSLLYQLLAELTNDAYVPSNAEILCRREDGSILPMNVPFDSLGIKVGDHLILF